MTNPKRMIMLNQMAGPLFRELAEGLAPCFTDGALLFTGHPDTLSYANNFNKKLIISTAPSYDRRSHLRRAISWFRYLFASSRLIICSRKSDLFLLVSNPPLLGGWFWVLNKIFKRPYAVLVYDIYPDVLVKMGVLGVNNPIVWLWNCINKMVYRDAKVLITLGEHMARRLKSKYQGCKVDVEVVSPWADIHSITPLSYESNPLSQKFNPKGRSIVLYSGNMGKSHDIESMLEAVSLLSHRQDILFLFIGSGEYWQTALNFKNEHALANLDVYPLQAEDCLPYTMTLATLSLVTLDEDAEELMVPSKLFYYLAAGSAVVGVCKGENELRDIIESADCGICVLPRNSLQLASEIVAIIDDKNRTNRYKKNARAAAVSSYSREVGISRFISIFRKIGWIVLDPPKGDL